MSAVNRTSQAKAVTLERQKKALELRRMGLGYIEIGERLGIGKSQAQRLVVGALAEVRADITAEADGLRAEELSRLDAMMQGLWVDARKGGVKSIDRVLKIMERRAKLLGLDAPVRLAHAGDPDGQPIEHRHIHELSDADLEAIARAGLAGAAAPTQGPG